MNTPISVCGTILYYNNGVYYQQSLDSDVGVITDIESLIFKA